MKKTIKSAKGMMSGKDSIAGIRKGNKPITKAKADDRTPRASGGLCSSDWMASQKKS
jgi:hypothetical protein